MSHVIAPRFIGPTPGAGGYQVGYSCRFNSADSAYLTRTPGSASNRTTYTLSAWVKRAKLSTAQFIFSAGSSNVFYVQFTSSDTLQVVSVAGNGVIALETNQVFRDPSAWYHVVIAVDTNLNSNNSVRLYVNGDEVTSFGTRNNPSSGATGNWNNNVVHTIAKNSNSATEYGDFYLVQVAHVNGQQLTANDFGQFDSNRVWRPIKVSGLTYGTNGFLLDFADASNLGNDVSGNNNDYTSSGLATNDQMVDSPTKNYAVWDALDMSSTFTLADGNLSATSTAKDKLVRATIGVSSGKYYAEIVPTVGSFCSIGVAQMGTSVDLQNPTNSWAYRNDGAKQNNGSATFGYPTYSSGDTIGVAVDLDTGSIWFAKNNSWIDGDPSAGTSPSYTNVTNIPVTFYAANGFTTSSTFVLNSGQRPGTPPFTYDPPSGFKALNTANLPIPPIKNGAKYHDVVTYNGTGSSFSITSLAFQPDLVWIKRRDTGGDWYIYDSVRGAQTHSTLTNANSSAATMPPAETTSDGGLTSFNSNGFTLGTLAGVNTNGGSYVAYCWKRSTLSGFDIVTWTGDGTSNRNIAHGLGAVPAFAMIFTRSASNHVWGHHQKMTGAAYYIGFDNQYFSAQSNTTSPFGSGNWSSSQFMVSDAANTANANGTTYVAYLFAEVPGFSSFQSYTGNGSTDGPFATTMLLPRTYLVQPGGPTVGYANVIMDTARSPYNPAGLSSTLQGTQGTAEITAYVNDLNANGIKRHDTGGNNVSGELEFTAVWASDPFGGKDTTPVTAR